MDKGERGEIPKQENPFAKRVFALLEEQKQDVEDTPEKIAEDFFSQIHTSGRKSMEEDGLISYMLTSWFQDKLAPETSDKLFQVTMQAITSGELLNRTMDRMQGMEQDMKAYFGHAGLPYNHVVAVPIKESPLAMRVLWVEAKRMADKQRSELEKDGRVGTVIEPIIKAGRPGLWMSTKGIAPDPSKIELSEAA